MSRVEYHDVESNRLIAFGLDTLPFPGYFISVITPLEHIDDESNDDVPTKLQDWDTRPGMSLSGSKPVSRGFILEKMKELGIHESFITRVAMDLDPATVTNIPRGYKVLH